MPKASWIIAVTAIFVVGLVSLLSCRERATITSSPTTSVTSTTTTTATPTVATPTATPTATTTATPTVVSPSATPTAPGTSPSPTTTVQEVPLASSIAKGLEIPWALAFLPGGEAIFTERPGRVRMIDPRQGLLSEPLLTIGEVLHRGEGGLLGVAVHPDFPDKPYVFLYYTYQQGGSTFNKVVRFRKEGRTLLDRKVIIEGIPGAGNHNGGRIRFGPDKLLYIGAGDAGQADLAQSRTSLAGKVLRLNDDGTVPAGNPFPNSPVYSLGHRNPQGLAWDDRGRLWETEHGSSATDEVNLLIAGKNYGWPVIRGDARAPGLESPIVHSGNDTWAPSGLAFRKGSLFFAGLRGQSLYQLSVDSPYTVSRHLNNRFGRLRDVVIGPDGLFYILTSNRDGRGTPTAEDDQIIRVNPEKLPDSKP